MSKTKEIEMTARYLRVAGLCALVVFAVSAFAASAAQASTGPEWIVGASKTPLSGESVVTGKALNNPKLANGVANIECTGATSEAAIKGGNPGTDTGVITFTGCHVEGKSTCVATTSGAASGEIKTVKLLTELVYPETGEASALDAFYPSTGTEFAKFTLSGGATACGALNGKTITVSVLSTATAAPSGGPITAGQKCGALAQVGKETTEKFELTTSGEVAKLGALNAPATAVTKGSLRDAAGTLAITCKLEANETPATFSALFTQSLLTGEVYGWK